MKFKELGIKEEIALALHEMGITEPTDIQNKVIPKIIAGADVIGISKTGSGKTFAFATPIIDHIKPGEGIQILIVVPIRELSEQIAKEIRKFTKHLKLDMAVIYGGVSLQPQADQLRRASIVVGTPGRLLDHLRRNSLNLSRVKVVVLDEADKMASMGFIEDIELILKATPKTRQTLLFGATISNEIAKIRDRYMKSPIVISSESHVDKKLLDQYYYDIDMKEKFSLLVHLIKKEKPKLALVFCSTRRNSEIISKNLNAQGIHNHCIHGGLTQNRRLHVIDDFHKGRPEILVATAVAARGLDIKGISHVFNYDVPRDPEEYIHQIGRTARAGESGKAITLLSQNDHPMFSSILHKYRMNIPKLPKEEFPRVMFDTGRRHFDSQGQGRRFGSGDRGNRSNDRRPSQGGWGRSDRRESKPRFGE